MAKVGQNGFARSTAGGFITNASTFDNNPQALLGGDTGAEALTEEAR